MEKLLSEAKEFIEQNPEYGYILAGVVLLIVSIGNFLNWNWATSPADYKQRYWSSILGHDTFRRVMGLLFLIGSIACFTGFYLS